MKKLNFSIQINAPKAQVWQTLWDNDTYPKWTAAFAEGCYAESDWQEGSKILFLGDKGSGMTSRIARKIPNQFMSFEHLGTVKNGIEDFDEAASKGWSGSFENYTLEDKETMTNLLVTLDAVDDFEDYFIKTFPLALDKVKALAEASNKTLLTIEALINVPEDKVWELWTAPEHIMQWNHASDDWHTTAATNDVQKGGRFSSTMAAKDGSFSFDFWGIYDTVKKYQTLAYTMGDGRKAEVTFTKKGQATKVTTVFEAETENPPEMQQAGWQAIMNNFKKYAEKSNTIVAQKITPFLWFNDNAEEAINFYTSVFDNSKINQLSRNPDGKVFTGSFQLCGQNFAAINGGPTFELNPSVSFYVACETAEEVDKLWEKLAGNEPALLPLGTYPWSERYGWTKDRFGMTWQITVDKTLAEAQKITPSLLFTQESHGRGNEALDFYTSVFSDASIVTKALYAEGQNTYATAGMVLFSHFKLNNQSFIIMDAGAPQPYTFNEAFSLVINCENQTEIDYYWNKLTENGGAESRCGWLKDKFGVSWQVVPTNLSALLGNKDAAKAQRAMQALMQMNKLDMAILENA